MKDFFGNDLSIGDFVFQKASYGVYLLKIISFLPEGAEVKYFQSSHRFVSLEKDCNFFTRKVPNNPLEHFYKYTEKKKIIFQHLLVKANVPNLVKQNYYDIESRVGLKICHDHFYTQYMGTRLFNTSKLFLDAFQNDINNNDYLICVHNKLRLCIADSNVEVQYLNSAIGGYRFKLKPTKTNTFILQKVSTQLNTDYNLKQSLNTEQEILIQEILIKYSQKYTFSETEKKNLENNFAVKVGFVSLPNN